MHAYCDTCGTERDCHIVLRDETYPVRGERVTVRAKVLICNVCGTDLFDVALDERNVELAFREYRRRRGLVSKDDIIRTRAMHNLSQEGLATLLGWSSDTVERYELGALPSAPHSEQLRRFRDDLNYAKELFDARNAQLGTLERLRVGKQLERLSVTSKHQDQDFDPGWLLVTYST